MTERRVSLWQIALNFNRIALSSFGGGLGAWSRKVVVEERGWMSEAEFLAALTVCRVCRAPTRSTSPSSSAPSSTESPGRSLACSG